MKTNLYRLAIAALSVAVLASCEKKEQDIDPVVDPGTVPGTETPADLSIVRVNLGIDETTRAHFADQLGIVWDEGDAIRFWGNTGSATATLAAENILEGGIKASFDIAIPNVVNESPKGVFQYNWSLRNEAEWDFGETEHKAGSNSILADGATLTVAQSEAGVMNKSFLFLQSATKWDDGVIPQAESTPVTIEATMHIVGTVIRVLPYTEDYNDETVQSATFAPNSDQKLGGVVAYNYAEGSYRDAQTINWLSYKKNIVNLTNGFSLSGVTSRETSKGIYFAVPATTDGHALQGYTVTVKTDKATYTYSSDESLAIAENTVRNIFLKLDEAHRTDDLAVKGTYNFWGSIGADQTWTFPSAAQSNQGLGYWVVSVLNTGETARQTIEANAHPEFYVATFTCIDDATSAPADWLTVGYRPNDTWWIASLQENTASAPRSATVTATFPEFNNGYTVEDGFATRTIHIVQKGQVVIVPQIGNLSATTIPADGGSVTATLNLTIDGAAATEEQFNEFVSDVTLTAENGSVSRDGHTLTISSGLNPKTEPRTITVTAAANGGSSSVQVVQAASASALSRTFSYGFSAWQNGTKTFTRSYGSADAVSAPDWMIVLTDLKDDLTGQVPTAADTKDLLKYGFQLTDAEYEAMAAFVVLDVEYGAGETKIWYRGVTANAGAARTFDKWWKTSDLSTDFVHVTISQAKAPAPAGTNMWPDLTVDYSGSYYNPGWAGEQAFPAITAGASNSSYAFTIPTATNDRWQCQFVLQTDLPQLNASKNYIFKASVTCTKDVNVRFQLMTPGVGYPVDEDVPITAGVEKLFTKEFTGYALVNAKLLLDFGWTQGDNQVLVKDIVIAETAE